MKLERYSKERGAGDQTSGGRGKLLRATSNLDNLDIVVRETLQNSWDARLESERPEYGIRIYKCDENVKKVLKDQVFTDLPTPLKGLESCLEESNLHVLEIFDRGTSGLDGPFTPSKAAQEGEPNNFNSFVFDIGTSKESGGSGGTFGFGKTAAFEVSSVHSLVYWSVVETEDGQFEDRLIASSLDSPYELKGKRHTGAHWWGQYDDSGEIIPLRGPAAGELGRKLFRTHFEPGKTGTSIIIIDPLFSIQGSEEAASQVLPIRSDDQAIQIKDQIKDSIAHNAWPKVADLSYGNSPMELYLFLNRIEQQVMGYAKDVFNPFIYALSRVRDSQDGGKTEAYSNRTILAEEVYRINLRPNDPHHSLEEYFGSRTDRVSGHLYLMKCLKPDPGDEVVSQFPSNSLCVMRSKAELVVNYDKVIDFEDDFFEWFGVFKPTPETDHHFAASEPATHDSWNASSTNNPVSTYVVEKTYQNIRRRVNDFLRAHKTKETRESFSVRNVSLALKNFLPLPEMIEEEISGLTPRRRTRSKEKTDSLSVGVLNHSTPHENCHVLEIIVNSSTKKSVKVSAHVLGVTLNERIKLEPDEYQISFHDNENTFGSDNFALFPTGHVVKVEIRTIVPTAVDVRFSIEDSL